MSSTTSTSIGTVVAQTCSFVILRHSRMPRPTTTSGARIIPMPTATTVWASMEIRRACITLSGVSRPTICPKKDKMIA